MSYEEEDTCALCIARARFGGKVEEEDTCHMRRRIHVRCASRARALVGRLRVMGFKV
jgi:hypothetical protein